jgi:hypothetical protein
VLYMGNEVRGKVGGCPVCGKGGLRGDGGYSANSESTCKEGGWAFPVPYIIYELYDKMTITTFIQNFSNA